MDEGRSNSADANARSVARCTGVSVATAARLHFGFLDPSGRGPEPFGSFGLSIDRPVTRLTLRRANSLRVSSEEAERAAGYLTQLAESYGLTTGYTLNVDEAIPPHSGLGSGTQLALAVGTALSTLEGLGASPQEIAGRLGRGVRSGIGIATFAGGGVVLDSGPVAGTLPQLVARLPFPEEWRVLSIRTLPEFMAGPRSRLSRRQPIFRKASPRSFGSGFSPARCRRSRNATLTGSPRRSDICKHGWAIISLRFRGGPSSVAASPRCSIGSRH